ncbi:hypothetical protein BDD12DRAFT_861792 [Trichophaea hybrida]|nr:hypothetical protein BDD12DRAFT_861792 [Trichophaea hybrida]
MNDCCCCGDYWGWKIDGACNRSLFSTDSAIASSLCCRWELFRENISQIAGMSRENLVWTS